LRIVDLSRMIQGRMPTVPFQTHPKSLFTRIEAPAFVIRHGRTIDQLPVEGFVRSAVLLDLSRKDVGEIDDEDLEGAEEAAGLSIREGEVVVLHTCWDETSKRRPFPGLSRNAADYLLFRRIAGVGVDCLSIDEGKSMRSHRVLLRNGVSVIEDLCNLSDIDQSRFRLVMLPLRMKAAVSPARIVGLLGESYW